MEFVLEPMYSIRGVRGARKYVYFVQGMSLEQIQLESLERVQILAHRYIPSEGRIRKIDITGPFLRFQRRVRDWALLRRAARSSSMLQAVRKREVEYSSLVKNIVASIKK